MPPDDTSRDDDAIAPTQRGAAGHTAPTPAAPTNAPARDGEAAIPTIVDGAVQSEVGTARFESPAQIDERPATAVRRGALLKDRYLVEHEIGRGGMGIVYFARDQQLFAKPVVVKVLTEAREQGGNFKVKFFREAEALARIDHPGVVGVLDMGEAPDGKPFFVMQFVDGVNLRTVMSEGPLERERIVDVVEQVAAALAVAHARGIYHRDLKPENIMLQTVDEGDVRVKIIDFGLATVTESEVFRTADTMNVSGTFPYMAPEQLRGKPGASSDIYALGVIAYELLAGRRPFNPDSPFQMLELQRNGLTENLRELRPDLDEAVDRAVFKALSFEAKDRHARATEFADELAAALRVERSAPALEPTTEPAAEPPELETVAEIPPVAAPRSGPKRTAVAAVAAVAALVAIGGALAWPRAEPEPAPAAPAAPAAPVLERALTYWVTAQRYRDGRPNGEPFQLTREMIFEPGFRVRLNVGSSEAGHLYVVNEGPVARDGAPSYVVLFPTPTTNGGSARLDPGGSLQIPERGWFEFDDQEGTEKVWLVWSAEPVPALEAVAPFVNTRDRGAVPDPALAAAVRDFLAAQSASSPRVEPDEEQKRTTVREPGGVLAYLIRFEHH